MEQQQPFGSPSAKRRSALARLAIRAHRLFHRPPDFLIGGLERPYIRRWYVIPRNRWLNLYLHHILRSDDDRALHDHPWANVSILLNGSYVEVMPDFACAPTPHTRIAEIPTFSRVRRRGSIVFRKPTQCHRLEIHERGGAWSLFITGPKVREWGFHCEHGFRHWLDFVSPSDRGAIGRGCDN